MNRNHLLSFILFLLLIGFSFSANAQDADPRNIIEVLSAADSTTNASVKFFQDKRIEQSLINKRNSGDLKKATASGFRVQVFSSNVQRTAKADAFRIERMVRDQFPDQTIYVNYISPFWKVRVGDFRTQSQAQAFRSQLIDAFPQIRSEVYVVREQIIIEPGTK